MLHQYKKCVNCGAEIRIQALFCTNCGAEQSVKAKEPEVEEGQQHEVEQSQSGALLETKKCVNCGAEIRIQALFCTNCGAEQSVKAKESKVDEVQQDEVEQTQSDVSIDPKTEFTPINQNDSPPKNTIEPSSTAKERKTVKTNKKIVENIRDWISIFLLILFVCIKCSLEKQKRSNRNEDIQQEYYNMSDYNVSNNRVSYNKGVEQREYSNPMTLERIYNDYVFGNRDFSTIAHSVCTPRLIRLLKDSYEYECEDGECYAMWLFRSGNPDGVSNVSKVTNVTNEGNGWFRVSYLDMGIEGATYIRLIVYDGVQMMDEIRRVC